MCHISSPLSELTVKRLLITVCVLNSALCLQLWPNKTFDLCKDQSVHHQWRQCKTEHWAFSFSTATSDRPWIMSHVSRRGRSSSRVSWKESRPFIRSSVRQESTRGSLARGVWPDFHICVCMCSSCLIRSHRCMIHDTQTAFRRTEEGTFHDRAFQHLGSHWVASGGLWRTRSVCLIVSHP